jgi:hypothetical protein
MHERLAPVISQSSTSTKSLFSRLLWLYGLYALLNNLAFLFGYYFLPEGFMRSSPQVGVGRLVATAESFWMELALTLVLNLGIALLAVALNLNQVRGFPVGYVLPISLAITGGLIVGTNSFAASDLRQYNAWEGMALGQSIGGLEMLAYILVIAATANLAMYQYRSWWRWGGEWSPRKIKRFRDLKLTKAEVVFLIIAVLLFFFAAFRETMMVKPI